MFLPSRMAQMAQQTFPQGTGTMPPQVGGGFLGKLAGAVPGAMGAPGGAPPAGLTPPPPPAAGAPAAGLGGMLGKIGALAGGPPAAGPPPTGIGGIGRFLGGMPPMGAAPAPVQGAAGGGGGNIAALLAALRGMKQGGIGTAPPPQGLMMGRR